jgi:hypothetical protein
VGVSVLFVVTELDENASSVFHTEMSTSSPPYEKVPRSSDIFQHRRRVGTDVIWEAEEAESSVVVLIFKDPLEVHVNSFL